MFDATVTSDVCCKDCSIWIDFDRGHPNDLVKLIDENGAPFPGQTCTHIFPSYT